MMEDDGIRNISATLRSVRKQREERKQEEEKQRLLTKMINLGQAFSIEPEKMEQIIKKAQEEDD